MTRILNNSLFAASAPAFPPGLETKDETISLTDIKAAQTSILETFEKFKEKNDLRLKELESKGAEDPVDRDQIEKINAELMELKDAKSDLETLYKQARRPGGDGEEADTATQEELDHKSAFEAFLRSPDTGSAQLKEAQTKAIASLTPEQKAVSTLTDTSGGYAVPEIISRRIHRELPEHSSLRGIVDVIPVGSKDYKELVDVRGTSYGWVGEGDARAETDTSKLKDIAPTFGMIYAHPMASEESLDDMFFNIENWIVNSTLDAFAEGEESAIISGNGIKKPTGFLNGGSNTQKDGTRAFGTLQHFATGVADGFHAHSPLDVFLKTIYSLKKGYRRNARWMMNKLTVGAIMEFKDADGNYIWQPSAQAFQPDRLKGFSIAESEEMPDIAAGSTPVAFGDFKAGYVLTPLVGLRLTRDEVTTPGYVKWYIRHRIGGCLRKSEALKLIKLAA